MSVSAVVVTYNRLKLLKECIKNLLVQSYKLDNIFIINNNSSDGTSNYLNRLSKKQPKIIVRNLHVNIGGAGGFSLGTKLAYEYGSSKYFWLMDDDTMPTSNALYNLIQKTKDLHNFGFLCSNVRWWKDYSPCNMPHVAKDWTKLINKSLVKVITSTFVSVLIPREDVKKVGLPIGRMFIWGDDTEYTTRLSRLFDSYFVSSSIVLHKSKSNKSYETIYNASKERLKFYKYMYRNLIYIDRKYYPCRRLIKDILRFCLGLIEIPVKSKNNRLYRMFLMGNSIISGIFFNPKIKFPKIK